MKLKLFALLLMASSGAFAQAQNPRLAGLDGEINNLLHAYNAAGLSMVVVENGKVVYSHGYGLRDVGNKLPVTPDTIFPIGSTTKSFTASLLGMLEAEGRLSLKDKPAASIPGIQFYNQQMDDLITVEDLLSHSTGIGNVDGSYIFFPTRERAQLLGRLKYLKPNGTPRRDWIYSNFGYVIAGSIAEKVTGKTWEQNISERIFTPLHMTRSSTSIKHVLASDDHSLGYGIANGILEPVLYADLGDDAPGGGINSTANDVAAWMLTWLNNGKFAGAQIIPIGYIKEAESYKAIDNGAPPDDGDPGVYAFGYGLGWKINSQRGITKSITAAMCRDSVRRWFFSPATNWASPC